MKTKTKMMSRREVMEGPKNWPEEEAKGVVGVVR